MNESITPFLSSYQGLSGDQLMGLAEAQSTYDPQPPLANQAQALSYIQSANQATDPALKSQLLQDAIDLLTPDGGSPGAVPTSIAPTSTALPATSPVGTAATPSAGDGVDSSATPLSVSGNSINTGMYTITGSPSDDGSLTITNNQTGQTTEVWGDPHIKVNGQDMADFQKDPLNIQLQDGTVIHIDPTALNSNGVAHIGQVSVTKGDQTVTMGGASSNGFEGGVTTSSVMDGISSYSSALFNSPSATDITLGSDGNLYYDNANGSMGSEITATNGGETDLDGAGGGLVGDPASAGSTTASSGNMDQQVQQLESLLQQFSGSFYATMMQSSLSQMMSTSGYASA